MKYALNPTIWRGEYARAVGQANRVDDEFGWHDGSVALVVGRARLGQDRVDCMTDHDLADCAGGTSRGGWRENACKLRTARGRGR